MVRVKNILIIVNAAAAAPAKTADFRSRPELWQNRVTGSEAGFERLR
jgi:hypothetical protein